MLCGAASREIVDEQIIVTRKYANRFDHISIGKANRYLRDEGDSSAGGIEHRRAPPAAAGTRTFSECEVRPQRILLLRRIAVEHVGERRRFTVRKHPSSAVPGRPPTRSTRGVVATLPGVRGRRRPEREPVGVLRGEHHVAGPGGGRDAGEPVEIGRGRRRVERRDEVVVPEAGAVGRTVVARRRRARDAHRVAVPLGVRDVREHRRRALLAQQGLDVRSGRRPRRDRVQPPVDEQAQLGVVVPGRQRTHVGAHGDATRDALDDRDLAVAPEDVGQRVHRSRRRSRGPGRSRAARASC